MSILHWCEPYPIYDAAKGIYNDYAHRLEFTSLQSDLISWLGFDSDVSWELWGLLSLYVRNEKWMKREKNQKDKT